MPLANLKNVAAERFLHGCRDVQAFVTLLAAMQSFNAKSGNLKKPKRRGETVTVGRASDVPEGRGATVELADGTELALYHIGGEFYAIENFCPHKGAPLADGQLCGHTVECDWHGWRFDVSTGQCLNHPHSSVEPYEVLIEDGWIKIAI